MVQLAICSFLIGAVFGLRFKVMVLLPVTFVGVIAVAVGNLVLGQPLGQLLFGVVAFALALQAGYLFGSFTRFVLVAMRASRAFPARSHARVPAKISAKASR